MKVKCTEWFEVRNVISSDVRSSVTQSGYHFIVLINVWTLISHPTDEVINIFIKSIITKETKKFIPNISSVLKELSK